MCTVYTIFFTLPVTVGKKCIAVSSSEVIFNDQFLWALADDRKIRIENRC